MKIRFVLALAIALTATAQNGDRLPVPASGNVTLPLDEYTRLVERARRPVKPSDTPPLPSLLKSAEFNLVVNSQVNGESVSGTVLIDGEIFASGDRRIPLLTGMTVLDARHSGRELPLQQSDGVHYALLPGPAEFSLTLTIGLPLTIEPGRATFNLPVPTAGAARLTLTVPGEQTQVNLNPGLITRRTSSNGKTLIEATLVPSQMATISWAARLTSQPAPADTPKEVRFLSDLKTLISVAEADLTIASLAEITVVQGDPAQFTVLAPDGYELTGASGPTLVQSDVQGKSIVLKVGNTAARNHQFLISMVKDNAKDTSATKVEVPLLMFQGAQRETGEVLVEADGAIELAASERAGLRRMDLKEVNPSLRSLSRAPIHAAFRYTKKPAETPAVALEWTRFPASSVLSAVAQQAVVTTLVTSEGRSLTEVKLTLKNQSQPFLKVALPAGATILSADVAGEKVKPVEGADGNRVPLLRPGFRPTSSYVVSFVFVHAGAPFSAKKGGADLALPKMDLPIGMLEWEVFLPDRFKVADFGGDAISARLFPRSSADGESTALLADYGSTGPFVGGRIGGTVTDPSGALIPNVKVTVLHRGTGRTFVTNANAEGQWSIENVPSGVVRILIESQGFTSLQMDSAHDASTGSRFNSKLDLGGVSQTVEVNASVSTLQTSNSQTSSRPLNGRYPEQLKSTAPDSPSANVADLQRRVAGVLPIAVSVPRTGSSYRFVRPLVVDQETKLTFSYRSK